MGDVDATTGRSTGCPESFWISPENGETQYNLQCASGHGELEYSSSQWYLFAGQMYGNVMDFSSEPWDSTCESEGTGTADTGLDLASWNLTPGEYALVFYPREDGTAIDAFYLTTPLNPTAPRADFRLDAGGSTIDCNDSPSSSVEPEAQAEITQNSRGDLVPPYPLCPRADAMSLVRRLAPPPSSGQTRSATRTR